MLALSFTNIACLYYVGIFLYDHHSKSWSKKRANSHVEDARQLSFLDFVCPWSSDGRHF